MDISVTGSKPLFPLMFLIFFFSTWPLFFIVFLILNFGSVSFSEITAFLSLGDRGVAGADTMVIFEFILLALGLPITLALWAALQLPSLSSKPKIFGAVATLFAAVTILLFSQVIEATSQSALGKESQLSSTLINLKPEERAPQANIIHIFIESFSSDLSTSGRSTTEPQSIIINSLGPGYVSRSLPADDVGGTIGGIASSLCGINSNLVNFLDAESSNYLLREEVCLSDALSIHDYQSTFFGAASGEFQSKSEFLKAHKFEVFEKNTWMSIGAPEPFAWGQTIHDDRLFDHGRAIAQNLISEDRPFLLTGLTLDNHYPYYTPSSCGYGTDQFSRAERAYLCSSSSVAGFIEWYRNHTDEPTLIVVQGDHPPGMDISSKRDIFFAASCHGEMVENPNLPDSVEEIAPFVLSAAESCR